MALQTMKKLFVDTAFDEKNPPGQSRLQKSPKIYCALESGDAREFIPAPLLSAPDQVWAECSLTRPSKGKFVMRDLNGDFLMSATVEKDRILIHTFEEEEQQHLQQQQQQQSSSSSSLSSGGSRPSTAGAVGSTPRRYGGSPHGYQSSAGAELKRASTRFGVTYTLQLCVGAEGGLAPPILEVRPALVRVGDLELRQLHIELVLSAGEVHFRHDPALTRLVSTPNGTRFEQTTTTTTTTTTTRSRRGGAAHPRPQDAIQLASKLPKLNNRTLIQKFRPGRVAASSSKNYLVFTKEALDGGGEARLKLDDANLQLGKLRSKTFSLDFRHPFSPIQALAVALAAFDSKTALR